MLTRGERIIALTAKALFGVFGATLKYETKFPASVIFASPTYAVAV